MAAQAHTTGIDPQAEELRRRNVSGQTTTPAVAQAPIKEKSKEKVQFPKQFAMDKPHCYPCAVELPLT
jgi:hypothetical protein